MEVEEERKEREGGTAAHDDPHLHVLLQHILTSLLFSNYGYIGEKERDRERERERERARESERARERERERERKVVTLYSK